VLSTPADAPWTMPSFEPRIRSIRDHLTGVHSSQTCPHPPGEGPHPSHSTVRGPNDPGKHPVGCWGYVGDCQPIRRDQDKSHAGCTQGLHTHPRAHSWPPGISAVPWTHGSVLGCGGRHFPRGIRGSKPRGQQIPGTLWASPCNPVGTWQFWAKGVGSGASDPPRVSPPPQPSRRVCHTPQP
jgi:hypothetical protein